MRNESKAESLYANIVTAVDATAAGAVAAGATVVVAAGAGASTATADAAATVANSNSKTTEATMTNRTEGNRKLIDMLPTCSKAI